MTLRLATVAATAILLGAGCSGGLMQATGGAHLPVATVGLEASHYIAPDKVPRVVRSNVAMDETHRGLGVALGVLATPTSSSGAWAPGTRMGGFWRGRLAEGFDWEAGLDLASLAGRDEEDRSVESTLVIARAEILYKVANIGNNAVVHLLGGGELGSERASWADKSSSGVIGGGLNVGIRVDFPQGLGLRASWSALVGSDNARDALCLAATYAF